MELGEPHGFKPAITEFILVTTAPRDVKIQQRARELTHKLASTPRPIFVAVSGWEDVEEHAAKHPTAWLAFDPTYNPIAHEDHRETLARLDEEFRAEQIGENQDARSLIDPDQRARPGDVRDIGPTDLLQARYEVVPYVDVAGMKADLIAWCQDRTRTTAGRLVHGPGGVGKTRLMIEVAAALRPDWTAGFLVRLPDHADDTLRQRRKALKALIDTDADKGFLIVIDYPEGRQSEVRMLAEQLNLRPDGSTRPIRVILLARSVGEWWTALHDETPEMKRLFRRDPFSADISALPTILTDQQRRDLFIASAKAFGPILETQGYVIPAGEAVGQWLAAIENGSGFDRQLAVQMAALLWLTSVAPQTDAGSVDKLLDQIIRLERGHWEKLIGKLDDDAKRDLTRGVAQVTLVQGTTSQATTERLLMADRFYQGQRTARVQVDPVVRHLARIYAKNDGGIAHLEPDLIGEHHVAIVGDIELVEGCLQWIEAGAAETRGKRRSDLLTVLQRATDGEHGAWANKASELLDLVVKLSTDRSTRSTMRPWSRSTLRCLRSRSR